MPSLPLLAHVPITVRLADASTRIGFSLPDGWFYHVEQLPEGTPPMDPEGRLPVRITARNEDDSFKLKVAGAQLKLPMGVMPAAVYWAQFYGLSDFPEDETRWAECETLSGVTTVSGAPETLVGVAWLQTTHAVLQWWLEGPAEQRDYFHGVWALIRESLACTTLASPRPTRNAHESWWMRVENLRSQGKLDEAVDVAERDGDRAEVLLVQADLHAERMRRAQTAGQLDVAREAWQKAADCAFAYAASATSGGEGAARSLDRDRILASLGPEPT